MRSAISVAGLGISDVHIGIEDSVRSHDSHQATLFFAHGRGAGAPLLSYSEESRGTRQWLGLLVPALEVLEAGSVFVVDEIDSSLHPLLVAQLVRLFRSEQTNPHGAQLLFTAHNTSLLGTALGDDVLARDQIWFVETDTDGASKIYPLNDFHPRRGENAERRYLGGSYGAVPVLADPDHGEVHQWPGSAAGRAACRAAGGTALAP